MCEVIGWATPTGSNEPLYGRTDTKPPMVHSSTVHVAAGRKVQSAMMTKCQAQSAEAAATMEMVMFIAQHLTHRFVYGSVSLGMTLPDKCYRWRSRG